jgi:hypothetical protein
MSQKFPSSEVIGAKILSIRGKKVILDHDLAKLYGVETKYLNRQVRRNLKRFPQEFMFRLNPKEKEELVTNWHQFGKLKHSYSMPYAFTEHGVAMLSSILNSETAIKISIHIISTFIRLRKFISRHDELWRKLAALEQKVDKHDAEITSIIEAIRELISSPRKTKREIGFHAR